MTSLSGENRLLRAGEWLAALAGAINCILVPALFAQSGGLDFPFPALYFIEIILLGVLVLGYVALRPRVGARWQALPWAAAGILLAFVVLGGFSIGPFLVPACVAFVAAGVLGDQQTGGLKAQFVGVFLLAAVLQAAVMVLFISIG